jgi:hypothetical protein
VGVRTVLLVLTMRGVEYWMWMMVVLFTYHFYHWCITVCITVCWCCRVLVMPVLLLLIVIVSVIIAINGYSCYSVAVYCWIACESCKLFITYVVRACTITITLLVVCVFMRWV